MPSYQLYPIFIYINSPTKIVTRRCITRRQFSLLCPRRSRTYKNVSGSSIRATCILSTRTNYDRSLPANRNGNTRTMSVAAAMSLRLYFVLVASTSHPNSDKIYTPNPHSDPPVSFCIRTRRSHSITVYTDRAHPRRSFSASCASLAWS